MKLNNLLIVACLSMSTLSTISCKKSNSNNTKDMLQGSWKLTQFGFDANNNNKIDPGETSPETDGSITFNSNNTGSLSLFGSPDTFSYSVNGKTITANFTTYTGSILITDITDKSLTLKGEADSSWTIWSK